MAMLDQSTVETISAPSRGVAQIAVTAFVGVLALATWGAPLVTAALGAVLLAFGFLLALGLVVSRSSKSAMAWDLAAVTIFLGFVATLVSDVSVAPL